MFSVKFIFKNEEIGSEDFETFQEAENKFELSDFYHKSDRFEIIDLDKDEIVDENEIFKIDDIIDDMFDDEDSKEGIDW